ncbi:MAG: hydratase, partial [Solobacterium sp.]|nr:hydratase [Solobacterium sp.]
IKPWPKQYALEDAILTKVVSFIDDPLTTTDELIPSGETSSFRSNPLRLAEYTLSRRDPSYVNKAKDIQELSKMVNEHTLPSLLKEVGEAYHKYGIDIDFEKTTIGSSIYANKPGDGSAREQAASCQRVLGAIANFAQEYATKRYRSNCINWGILPFVTKEKDCFEGAWVYLEGIYEAMEKDKPCKAYVLQNDKIQCIEVELGQLSAEEKKILCAGSLINYYKES